ncbi:hypothetical protein AAC387_Pa04g0662 [Persea americana]
MNEAQFSVIAIANSSTGLPYFVLLAPNVYSHERDITNPSPENERNMKSLPSLASHEYFADMNNRIEAFGRDKLIISHEQASVEVVGNAIVTKAKLNCSEFIGEGYGAILQALLSPNNDGPIVTTIEQLIVNEDYVGYQKGSFVFDLLKHMGFREEKLKAYSSIDEYATALSRGSSYNGVSAIVDEIPYIKVFLAKYADRYTMVRPTFSTMGFAFLFQRGCTIVPDVSRTILEFIEGNKMTELEKKWFTVMQRLLSHYR